MSSPPAPQQSRVASTVSEQREAVREQLAAAWQLQVSRIEEQLNAGWREQIERVFEERFAELAARLEVELAAELERARRGTAEEFHRAVRRLGGAETEEEWAAALLDSTSLLADRAAVFAVAGGGLKALCARGIAATELEIPAEPAFASAISTREPVACDRCRLFPIVAEGRVAAILYAEGEPIDANGLEALAALAGACRRPAARERRAAPDWSQLSREDQDLHLRAQRFARVRVAEMRLYKSQAVHSGRAQRNLYAALKEDIDSAREAFRRDFISASPAMPDYFHLELLRTLANDDVGLLGEDYPGPLF
jgi:hypothetical protein